MMGNNGMSAAVGKRKFGGVIKKITGAREFGLTVAFAVLIVLALIITPDLFQVETLLSNLRNYAYVGIMVLGMMGVIITGGIDLSVGSTLALTGAITATILNNAYDNKTNFPTFVLVIIGIAVGAVCGFINGVLIGKLKVQPMIATLATMYIYRGAAYIVSGGTWITASKLTDGFKNLTTGKFLGIYHIIWYLIILIAIFAVFYRYTTSGRRFYAVGTNEESAKIIGIKTDRVKILAYTVMGTLAGFCGILFVSNLAIFNASIGDGVELDVIAICVLGGVSIVGGKGTLLGAVIAFLMMTIVSAFLSMITGMSVWSDALKGLIIVVAVLVNVITAYMSEKRTLKERVI